MEEKEVLLTAQEENLPIVAVFVGGDWCLWSQQFIHEVLKTPLFLDKIGKETILWEIALEKQSQDDAMRQKYGVTECPHVLLLDPKGKEFARLGFTSLDPESYADEIIGLIDDFQEICTVLDQKEGSFNEEYWKDLYLRAQRLSVSCYSEVILDRGLKKEKGTFFHLEKFASLLQKHTLKSSPICKMKKQLHKKDPENKRGTHFKMASLEFQKTASDPQLNDRYEKVLQPLLQYVQRFGKKDPENLWQAEMMIAKFLFAKNHISSAIEHARSSYREAPDAMKLQIAETISSMKGHQ